MNNIVCIKCCDPNTNVFIVNNISWCAICYDYYQQTLIMWKTYVSILQSVFYKSRKFDCYYCTQEVNGRFKRFKIKRAVVIDADNKDTCTKHIVGKRKLSDIYLDEYQAFVKNAPWKKKTHGKTEKTQKKGTEIN
ncbi:hypothetical protein CMI47_13080 [Candidatus Pacearchaeota archaeon]|nr:hypothetical protein [Candidatus Pacearchaeota archaeon]|tara:strand:+ start:161 stop:565 length:405 start_codon:yes stop_codon:yes gene_type:complete